MYCYATLALCASHHLHHIHILDYYHKFSKFHADVSCSCFKIHVELKDLCQLFLQWIKENCRYRISEYTVGIEDGTYGKLSSLTGPHIGGGYTKTDPDPVSVSVSFVFRLRRLSERFLQT